MIVLGVVLFVNLSSLLPSFFSSSVLLSTHAATRMTPTLVLLANGTLTRFVSLSHSCKVFVLLMSLNPPPVLPLLSLRPPMAPAFALPLVLYRTTSWFICLPLQAEYFLVHDESIYERLSS